MKPYNLENIIYNPVGLDAEIERLCAVLEELDWLEVAYRRAWLLPTLGERKTKNEWKVLSGTDYLTLTKDTDLRSFSLVSVTSGESYEKDMVWHMDATKKSRDIGIVFIVDLQRIAPQKGYIYTEELKLEIIEKLKTVEGLEIENYHDNDYREIFKGLQVDGTGFEWVLYPWAAMRFNGVLTYNAGC